MKRTVLTLKQMRLKGMKASHGRLFITNAFLNGGVLNVRYFDKSIRKSKALQYQSFLKKCQRLRYNGDEWVVPRAVKKHLGEHTEWVKTRCEKRGHPFHVRREDMPAVMDGDIECPVCKGLRIVDENFIDDVVNGRLLKRAVTQKRVAL